MLPHEVQILNVKGDMARVQFISHQFQFSVMQAHIQASSKMSKELSVH